MRLTILVDDHGRVTVVHLQVLQQLPQRPWMRLDPALHARHRQCQCRCVSCVEEICRKYCDTHLLEINFLEHHSLISTSYLHDGLHWICMRRAQNRHIQDRNNIYTLYEYDVCASGHQLDRGSGSGLVTLNARVDVVVLRFLLLLRGRSDSYDEVVVDADEVEGPAR